MSTQKTTNEVFTKRLIALVKEKTEGNGKKFAENAGIKQATFNNYLNGRLPNADILNNICNTYDVNLNWLVSGRGPKYIQNDDSELQPLDPNPEIAELMEGARNVLTSGIPEVFDALERNIRYYSRAIAAEKRADKIEKEMKEGFEFLKEEIARLKREKSYINTGTGEQSSEKKVA
jgi:transcriptional regulator with XRE-family HTH domain